MDSQFTAPLSQEILHEYNKLVDALFKVPEHLRSVNFLEGTYSSASDLVAYQIGWGKLLISWYEAGLKEEVLVMPGEGFSTWDYTGIAKHFFKKYRYDGLSEQDRQFDEVVKKILNFVEIEHQKGRLEITGIWKWCTLASQKHWPLAKWVKVNTASPYKRASLQLRKFLKTVE